MTVFVLNIAGLPGALLAGKPERRSKGQFVFGTIISGVGQLYVYLAYVAFIVSWTAAAANRDDVVGFIVWPVAFLSVFLPIWMNLGRARTEAREMEHASLRPKHFT